MWAVVSVTRTAASRLSAGRYRSTALNACSSLGTTSKSEQGIRPGKMRGRMASAFGNSMIHDSVGVVVRPRSWAVLSVVLLGALVLCACGRANLGSGPASSSRDSPSQIPTPSQTTVASSSRSPSPLPTTSSAPSPVQVAFPNCRLPYVKPASLGFGSAPFIGGFVSGAQGLWTADSAGQINQSGDLLVTSAKPTLTGSGSGSDDSSSYDRTINRWLPVRNDQVRADGLSYTYAEPFKVNPGDAQYTGTRIHVVSLPDGADRVIYSGSPRDPIAYQPEGIYVVVVPHPDGPASEMWLMNPTSGTSTQLPNGVGFRLISHGIAWTDYWVIMPRGLARIDVSTGASQTWVDASGEGWIWFVGLDSNGNPLVDVSEGTNSNWRLFVYTAPQTRTLLGQVSITQIGTTDSHGTWLAGRDGIYLLESVPQLVKVSDVTGGNVAGACN